MTEHMTSFRTVRSKMKEWAFHYCKYSASRVRQVEESWCLCCLPCLPVSVLLVLQAAGSRTSIRSQVCWLLCHLPRKLSQKFYRHKCLHRSPCLLPKGWILQLSLKPSIHEFSIPVCMNFSLNFIAYHFPVLHLKDVALCAKWRPWGNLKCFKTHRLWVIRNRELLKSFELHHKISDWPNSKIQ